MARIFVAGSTGVIGARLVSLLLGAGHAVVGMTRRPESAHALVALGAEAVVADALDRTALLTAVERARPDVVMHQLTDLAGGSRAANAQVREVGTHNLVDAARAAGVRRVIAQSIAWAYAPGDDPADEATPLDTGAPEPRQTTIRGIAALESAVHEAREWVVLRYGLLYGPGTWFARDGMRAGLARAGKLTADGDVTSFLQADDAAAAAVAALDWPSGTVNVCDDDPAPGSEWVPAFCAAVGAAPPPSTTTDRAGWARGASNRHAREDLGWAPRHPTWRAALGLE
jgi:nucleoside-diphosphate-sugar epimerase